MQLWNVAADYSGERDTAVAGAVCLEPRPISERFRVAEKDDIVLFKDSSVIILSNKG